MTRKIYSRILFRAARKAFSLYVNTKQLKRCIFKVFEYTYVVLNINYMYVPFDPTTELDLRTTCNINKIYVIFISSMATKFTFINENIKFNVITQT